LSDEIGRIYFLANLATFGITGGMLQRNGAKGTDVWIRVVGGMLSTLSKGWGRLAEGTMPTPAEAAIAAVDDSDDSDDDTTAGTRSAAKAPTLPPLPANVGSKLLLLTSTAHLSTLAGFVVNTTDSALLASFSSFAVGILQAFRGSSRWESTLDAVMDGKRGRALVKLLWREGVRGKWSNTSDGWDGFSRSESSIEYPTCILC
jgi:ubiquitin-protein ligase E3 C